MRVLPVSAHFFEAGFSLVRVDDNSLPGALHCEQRMETEVVWDTKVENLNR
jgi:hypothetical protein